MADLPPLSAVPDPDDPSDVDPDDLAFVEAQLAGLTYLRPDDAPLGGPGGDDPPMPEETWARLQAALRAEAPVVAGRGSRTARWAGGLVAAGVAVVAVGIAATVLRSGGGAVVADAGAENAAGAVAKMSAPSASAFAAADAAVPASTLAPEAADTSSGAPFDTTAADVVPAARAVLDSRTDYQPGALPGQVVSLVKQAGFSTLRDAVTKQMPPPAMPVDDGFTASWDRLRDCITWLTHSEQAQALVVDRGTYSGVEAGVVVAPAVLVDDIGMSALPTPSDQAPPSPSASIDTPVGMFDVWVVDPQCEQVAASLDDFALYDWAQ